MSLILCFMSNREVFAQSVVLKTNALSSFLAVPSNPYSDAKPALAIEAQCSPENGSKKSPQALKFKSETGIVNGMKVIEYEGLNYLFETLERNNYAGIQGFPALSSAIKNAQKNIQGTVNLPDAEVILKSKGSNGYFAGTSITAVVFSPKLRKIEDEAFAKCYKLQELIFPTGCEDVEIGVKAFSGCPNIKFVLVPKGKVSEFAAKLGVSEKIVHELQDCDITVEKAGTILDYISAENLDKIVSLKIKGMLDERDLAVIKGCHNLMTLDLSEAYTILSEQELEKRKAERAFAQAFLNAMNQVAGEMLDYGGISSLDYQQVQAFVNSAQNGSQNVGGIDGCVIPVGSFQEMPNLTVVKLPLRAVEIEADAFVGCKNLTTVELPLYLVKIGKRAFRNCLNLKDIAFPATLTEIDVDAFMNCQSMTKADFSHCTFNEWHLNVFAYVKLQEFRFPNGIKVLEHLPSCNVYYMPKSLASINCKLENDTIYFTGEEAPSLLLFGHVNKCTIYVPKESQTSYYAKFNNNGNVLKTY